MATAAAAAIAAVAGRARREIRDYFENAGAFDSDSATSYDPPSNLHARQLEFLIRQGILKDAGAGRFWIDRQAAELEAQRRKRVLKILLVAVLASLVVATGISIVLIRIG